MKAKKDITTPRISEYYIIEQKSTVQKMHEQKIIILILQQKREQIKLKHKSLKNKGMEDMGEGQKRTKPRSEATNFWHQPLNVTKPLSQDHLGEATARVAFLSEKSLMYPVTGTSLMEGIE